MDDNQVYTSHGYMIELTQLVTMADPASVAKSMDRNLKMALQGIFFIISLTCLRVLLEVRGKR